MNLGMFFLYIILTLSFVSCDRDKRENKSTVTVAASTPSATVNANAVTSAVDAIESVQNEINGTLLDSDETELHQPSLETFIDGETAYVTAPSAVVQLSGATITLPIGASVQVKGGESCSFGNEYDEGVFCVFIDGIYMGEIDHGFPDGLASENRFGHKKPFLSDLITKYDKTPNENQDIRRELAEKAIALNPWSDEANKRMLEVLNNIGDSRAAEKTKNTYRRYQEHQPQIKDGEFPTIFHFVEQKVVSFAANVNGVIKLIGSNTVNIRGTFLNIYGDRKIGFAVSTQTSLCESRCPSRIPMQNIGLDGKPTDTNLEGIYATNFTWPERIKSLPAVTKEQKNMLISLLKKKTANYSGEEAIAAQEALKLEKIDAMVGQLNKDGRIFLAGGLHIGSAGDSHYNNSPYISEFVIMEEQNDGRFIEAIIRTPEFKGSYCNISSILRDMNEDGADEIITYCNSAVEGPYDEDSLNGILWRNKNTWVQAF